MEKREIKVLLLEDNLSEADFIKQALASTGKEFTVQHVEYLTKGLEQLQSQKFDVVLSDLGLPDSQGLATVLTIRNQSKLVPIVVLTVLNDEEVALKSLQMDIQDYLIKEEINGPLLSRAICYAIRRKRDADALREITERFTSFMLHLPAAAWMKDLSGRYEYVNAEAERIFSSSLSELAGKTDEEFLPPGTARLFVENDRQVLATGESLQTVEVLREADGVEHQFIVSKFLVSGPDGLPSHVAGVALDVTANKRAETEIERLNADLLARAVELANANQELEAFNRTVAHDLRQPLNVLSTYCQAIQMMCGDNLLPECNNYIQEAYRVTRRMNSIIEALLNYSRIGHVELRRELFDLGLAAHEVARELKLTDLERQVDFRIAEGILVNADADLLGLALDNLIGNAWKYTAKREKAVIEVGVTEVDGIPVYFVRDNGTGFDMASADKLFVPFQRLPGAEEHKGFGVGLATVESIIRRHGGKIWAEGEHDKGAVFYFTLPEGGGIRHENPDS